MSRLLLLGLVAACSDPRLTEIEVDGPAGQLSTLEASLHAAGGRCRLLERISGDPGTPLLVLTCSGDAPDPGIPGARVIALRQRRADRKVDHPSLVARNYYEVPSDNLAVAEQVRLAASRLRERLDVEPGRVLARETAGDGPELIWEQQLVGVSKDLQSREARASADPRFQAIVARMRGLMSGFATGLYRVIP